MSEVMRGEAGGIPDAATPGDGAMVSQNTMVGAAAPTAEQVRAATVPQPVRREPRPPRPGAVAAAPPKRRRRWAPFAKGFAVVAVLLILIASGGWIATRNVYFLGTDGDGFVTLYSGLPYALPGVELFQTEFTTGVPIQELSPRVQKLVTEHKLRSEDDAVDLTRQLERGDLAGQNAQ